MLGTYGGAGTADVSSDAGLVAVSGRTGILSVAVTGPAGGERICDARLPVRPNCNRADDTFTVSCGERLT